MSDLQSVHNKTLELLHEVAPKKLFNQIRQPKLSDKELLALSLTAQMLGVDLRRHPDGWATDFEFFGKTLSVQIRSFFL